MTHVVRIFPRGFQNRVSQENVLFDEGRDEVKHPEHVITDQHLTVAARSRADADRWNLQPGGDQLSYGIRNSFEHQSKYSGSFECESVGDQFGSRLFVASLPSHSAQAMHMLWRQAEVSHNGQTGLGEPSNRIGDSAAAF